MATSLRAFQVGLFEEHLEEASFLYEQCRVLRQDKGTAWMGLAPFEQRLHLPLDALVVGGGLALEVCQRRAVEGDAGEKFAAASVFCRQAQAGMLSAMMGTLDEAEPETLEAVGDALKYELPASWVGFIDQALRRPDRRLRVPLAMASAYRRIPCEAALLAALADEAHLALPVVIALGRLRAQQAQVPLKALLHQPVDTQIKAAALLALARIGTQEPLRAHYLLAQKENWPRLALGLAGDAQAEAVLMLPLEGGQVSPDSLMALGLLGLPSSLRYLYECLADPLLAETAAMAMNLICGAHLFEQAFVPEALDEAELFPKEIRVLRQTGQPPLGADGKPFGQTVTRLTLDRERWKQWFSQHGQRFDPGLRYRWGQPCTPELVARGLLAEGLDPRLRMWSYEELCIRYGCDVPFDVDMPVTLQRRALEQILTWVRAHTAHFQPGRWYFAGHPA